MDNIRSLFKHNIFFTPVNKDRTSYISNDNFSINVTYISNKNIMVEKLNIRHVGDLLNQIDHFLYYLASKYIENKGNNIYEAFCQVDFCFNTFTYLNVKNFYTCECFDENILFLEKYSKNTRKFFESHSIFGEPFQIRILLWVDYIQVAQAIEEQDEEDEDNYDNNDVGNDDNDDDSKKNKPVGINKVFQPEDICVICLEKKPEILFLPCSHYSVCEGCEEMNPFLNCPFCRTRISSKFKI